MQKNNYKVKILLFLVGAIMLFFFSNDFGLIDIEKTAIITAIAIDKENENYLITAQIALPEASNNNTENKKTIVSGKGITVASAIKNIGDVSGWFPNMSFCNLIVLGKEFESQNIMTFLDYFAKTIRVQDFAQVVLADGEASELLNVQTPLDKVSSFGIQKILLKNPGFDSDVFPVDIKTFCTSYYSLSSSSLLPIIKHLKQQSSTQEKQSSNSEDDSSQKELFDASSTALFLKGIKVGELDNYETQCLNIFNDNVKDSTIEVTDVPEEDGEKINYLLTIDRYKSSIKLTANSDEIKCNISVDLKCKISDVDSNKPDLYYTNNSPIPQNLIDRTIELLKQRIGFLIEKEKSSGCDFLKLKEKLYRFNNKYYDKYKDNFLAETNFNIDVKVSGQK